MEVSIFAYISLSEIQSTNLNIYSGHDAVLQFQEMSDKLSSIYGIASFGI